jgi:hypothetical protein
VQTSGHPARGAECYLNGGWYSSARAFSFENRTTVDAGGNEVKREFEQLRKKPRLANGKVRIFRQADEAQISGDN